MARIYHTAHKRAKLRNTIRNLVTELIVHEHIKVTKDRKNQVKRVFDKLITSAKGGTLHDYRQILKIIRKSVKDDQNNYAFIKLKQLALKYKERDGGYLKIYNLGVRRGDAAELYYLSLI